MKYDKGHLSYEGQLERLRSRGLSVQDPQRGIALLKTVGYYRLSAYVYPFREKLPKAEWTPGHTRSETIMPGVNLEHVRAMWDFDRRVRLLVLDASEVIEVGLRTQIAYVLGRRDTFGHVHESSLDQNKCDDARYVKGVPERAFDMWIKRYDELREQAKTEDYVQHNLTKYDESPLAVWVAMEFLDFGAAVRLLGLMLDSDSNEIARNMGFTSGQKLSKVLLSCSSMRNRAAHHSRTWNRPPFARPPKIYTTEVDESLAHWGGVHREFPYGPLALMAYLVRHIDPTSRWPCRAREQLLRFPKVPYLDVHQNMGFPHDWAELPLWKAQPAAKK